VPPRGLFKTFIVSVKLLRLFPVPVPVSVN